MYATDIMNALELSALAYRNIQPASPKERLTVISDPKTDVQCYVRQRSGCLRITFRGSNTCQDWKTNLALKKKVVPYENHLSRIRVHSGFLDAYKSAGVRDAIHNIMSESIFQVRISGHSQGAALAILCGVDLEYNFPDKDYEVILFGAPRVGNRAFQKSYDRRVFKTLRVENGNDWATKTPFPLMGYRHVGTILHIGGPRIPLVFSRSSHGVKSYYKNLLKLSLSMVSASRPTSF